MTKAKLKAALQGLPMTPLGAGGYKISALEPLPLEFDEGKHQYTWQPTGEVMAYSVTNILQVKKSARALAAIDKTKHIWAPRGTYVHGQLETHLAGLRGLPEDWAQNYDGEYAEWVVPMLSYPLWEHFEPIALEYRVCDLRRSIGGSLDVLGWDHLTDRMCLVDLKTLGKRGSTYDTDPQLGGYLSMLIDHHKLLVDECLTVWASPGECHLGPTQPPDRCLQAWEDTYDLWASREEEL